jgi:hypothetical protein
MSLLTLKISVRCLNNQQITPLALEASSTLRGIRATTAADGRAAGSGPPPRLLPTAEGGAVPPPPPPADPAATTTILSPSIEGAVSPLSQHL